jgi:hypothetical protein
MATKRSSPTEDAGAVPTMCVLLVDCPAELPAFRGHRRAELVSCMQRNIDSGIFDRIVLLNEIPFDTDCVRETEFTKLIHIHTNKRLNYEDAFRYLNNFATEQKKKVRCVLSNADIAFDHPSFHHIRRARLGGSTVLASSRFNQEAGSTRASLHHNQRSSQDVWIFDAPNDMIAAVSFPREIQLGLIGCDNAIAGLLVKHGLHLVNTCRYMAAVHVHASGVRTRKHRIKIQTDTTYARSYPATAEQLLALGLDAVAALPAAIECPIAAPAPASASAPASAPASASASASASDST